MKWIRHYDETVNADNITRIKNGGVTGGLWIHVRGGGPIFFGNGRAGIEREIALAIAHAPDGAIIDLICGDNSMTVISV